jgi:hypothetical protein
MRRFIAERSAKAGDWGFKDPRTALVYPLWRQELPEHRIIAIWRHPEEVWPRFAAPGPGLYHEEPRRAWSFVQRWCEYNAGTLAALRDNAGQSLAVNYGDFMNGDQGFRRLEAFVGRNLQDRRRKTMYRSKGKRHPSYRIAKRLLGWTRGTDPDALVEALRALSVDGAR